ncbi:unnamed protein product [Acanthoscelides obtectus]|uniref:Helicase ATP-binding domain-containing protein n=1 Tax=Acanthoscelides obtectus TaxID=200917 RepID=A0A9P0LPQ2_ACAOB|nr:unnamed protein product [Acanthoscelides obtectus]CAK1632707.1 Probable RNA helicase armi [Acanthoscelides obtectus]
MWSYMTSFFWPSQKDDNLSLYEACTILETSFEEPQKLQTKTKTKEDVPHNAFCQQTGTISEETDSKYIIDNKFPYEKDGKVFPVGTNVTYSYFMDNGKAIVVDVDFVDGEWDEQLTQNGTWTTRILVCKVQQRKERKLFLNPGDLEIDLDNVCMEFIPMVGDWIELEVKCSVDEHAIDLFGKVLEINKIMPLRSHMVIGKISTWNSEQEYGTINKNIYFDKKSLVGGYVPVAGDKVITQVIESEQGRCVWRAVKVVPEFITKQNGPSTKDIQLCNFEDSYPELKIDYTKLNFERINIIQKFEVMIYCGSEKQFELVKVEFPNENTQCKIIEKLDHVLISETEPCKIQCECIPRTMGASKEFLLLTFKDFSIGKWLDINVTIQTFNSNIRFQPRNRKLNDTSNEQTVVKGQTVFKGSRFKNIRLPDYTVPKKLLSIVARCEQKDLELLIQELKIVKPSLHSNLSHTNYEDKFHTLLHIDEIEALLAMQRYDQERACFIQNGEILMLEIENLSERRPSILVGDKVIATDPLKRFTVAFEGFVHKVTAKHLHIKFSLLFHDKYNGEDYSIRIVAGRASYKRLHHAVYLAVRNLGPDILFPMRMYEKEPQVKFEHNLSKNNNNTPNNRLKHLQAKIEEIKSRKSSELTATEFKLEWYNTQLNEIQKNTVINILLGKARPLPYIIFGPPGTGKTVTIIETILQILRLLPKSRILVAAPSNSAVDLIALRLVDSGVLKPGDLVRLVSVNYALSDLIPPRLVPFCIVGSGSKEGTEQYGVQNGIQIGGHQNLMGRNRITISTCSSVGQLFTMGFPKGHFTHIVVDEAAQASEPDVMIPLSFLDKNDGQAILAGDPMQLGPVILSQVSVQFGLAESYLERLINRFPYIKDLHSFPDTCGYDPRLATKLLYNYRALPSILNMYSSLFYDGQLIPTVIQWAERVEFFVLSHPQFVCT